MRDLRDLAFTLPVLCAAYRAGVRPVDVMAEVYRRVEAAGDPGIFLHLIDRDASLAAAEALGPHPDPERPLWGIPFAVKDNIDVAGCPTTAACPAFAYQPERHAFAVARLCAAGAIPVGKTNLDQFATGLVGVRTPNAAPRNALDPALVPGGSSSGSAIAVARGLVAFSLGTDTAGSGRVPAALNNIVGLKPSFGAISTRGVVPACRTLDAVSIFALTVDDAWEVFSAAAGFDAADPYARRVAVGALGVAPPHPTIGIPDRTSLRFFGDAAQERAFAATCERLEALGARLVQIDFALFYAVAEMLYAGAWVAERHTVLQPLLDSNPEAINPVVREIVSAATGLTATDAFRGLYKLEALRMETAPLIDAVDLLCVPSIPTFYSLEDLARDPVGPNNRLGTYTNFVNLLGLCGLVVPLPARSDGRPGSATLLARSGRDGLLASLGRLVERQGDRTLGATGWVVPPLANILPAAEPGEIEIVVCGAHMSGLPLNRELARLGGRFLREAKTAPIYRLYSLAGGPPRRPGMLRASDGTGAAIQVEVWGLPRPALGDFLAGVPSPLSIGTVTLADGTSPKGFLCEPAGTVGATDVTALGDWRRVIADDAA